MIAQEQWLVTNVVPAAAGLVAVGVALGVLLALGFRAWSARRAEKRAKRATRATRYRDAVRREARRIVEASSSDPLPVVDEDQLTRVFVRPVMSTEMATGARLREVPSRRLSSQNVLAVTKVIDRRELCELGDEAG